MDQDPFAVWDEPTAPTIQEHAKKSAEKLARLSIEDARATSSSDNDDPGWGLPASPQKTRQLTPPSHQEVEEDAVSFQESHTRQTTPEPSLLNDGNDDDDGFQDFDQPEAAQDGIADDFGDFDDFEEGGIDDHAVFDDDEPPVAASPDPVPAPEPAPPSRTWFAARVTSASQRETVTADVAALLPLSLAAESKLTSDVQRQVPGEAQVLVAESSRTMWKQLCTMPSVKPIDWVRSKTRRDYLISMGIPVNLDEIHYSSASNRSVSGGLPPLKLDLGTGDTAPRRSNSSLSRSTTPSRNGTSSPAGGSSVNVSNQKERMAEKRRDELGLDAPPVVDLGRAQELVDKTESQLTLMSLPALKSMLRELQTLTNSTSVLLTHHLTLRESYQADSEMYNSMIKQLVTGAATRVSNSTTASSSNTAHGLRGGAVDRRSATGARLSPNPTPPLRNASINRSSAAVSPNLRGGAASR